MKYLARFGIVSCDVLGEKSILMIIYPEQGKL